MSYTCKSNGLANNTMQPMFTCSRKPGLKQMNRSITFHSDRWTLIHKVVSNPDLFRSPSRIARNCLSAEFWLLSLLNRRRAATLEENTQMPYSLGRTIGKYLYCLSMFSKHIDSHNRFAEFRIERLNDLIIQMFLKTDIIMGQYEKWIKYYPS